MVTGAMLKVLEGFRHWVARSIAGMTARRTESGKWEWPPVIEALDTVGLWPIKECIQRRQVTVAAQMSCRPIYTLCKGADRMPRTSRFMWWWDQDVGR